MKICSYCGVSSNCLGCAVCNAPYCNRDCQFNDWQTHRTICGTENHTIAGKFDTKEHKDAVVVSKHVRIIWDGSVPENKARMETNKDKKRIYLRLNRKTSAVYLVKRLNKIEKRRHEQGSAFWEVKKRETKPRDKSPIRTVPAKPIEGNEQSLLSALEIAYRKSKKDPRSLSQTFDQILSQQKRQSVDFANDILKLRTLADMRFWDRIDNLRLSNKDPITKEMEKIRNQIYYWIFDQLFEDVSVEFGELSGYVQEIVKEKSYNVKWTIATDPVSGRIRTGFRFHFHGKLATWMTPMYLNDIHLLMENYIVQRLGKGIDEDIFESIAMDITNFPPVWQPTDSQKDVKEFHIYYPETIF